MIANIITVSRMIFSVLLFAFSPSSLLFQVLYILCGVTDVLDGFVARKLRTESKTGALLDSIADLFFATVYAIKILPLLKFNIWIWVWIAIIAVTKITVIILKSKREQKFFIEHSLLNKLTGILIFLLPLTVRIIDIKYSVIIVCVTASLSTAQEILKLTQAKNEPSTKFQ